MNRKTKIEVIMALKEGLIHVQEAKQMYITLIDQGDGRYLREATGEILTGYEHLKVLSPVKMEIRDENRIFLSFHTFLEIMQMATNDNA